MSEITNKSLTETVDLIKKKEIDFVLFFIVHLCSIIPGAFELSNENVK
jgi:hypothetical protein